MRHFWCKTCNEILSEQAMRNASIASERGRIGKPVCSQGHDVKPVPLVSMPCPLCGATGPKTWNGKPRAWREEGRPCPSCEKEFINLKTFRTKMVTRNAELKAYRILTYPHLPHAPWDDRASDTFRQLILAFASPEPEPKTYSDAPIVPAPSSYSGGGIRADDQVRLTEEQARLIQILFDRLEAQLDDAYQKGKKAGEGFIVRIASGETSYADMEHQARIDNLSDLVDRAADVALSEIGRKKLKPEEHEQFKKRLRSVLREQR